MILNWSWDVMVIGQLVVERGYRRGDTSMKDTSRGINGKSKRFHCLLSPVIFNRLRVYYDRQICTNYHIAAYFALRVAFGPT